MPVLPRAAAGGASLTPFADAERADLALRAAQSAQRPLYGGQFAMAGQTPRHLDGRIGDGVGPADREPRLAAVLQVLYLIFNEGYAATSGSHLHRAALAREASGSPGPYAACCPARARSPGCSR